MKITYQTPVVSDSSFPVSEEVPLVHTLKIDEDNIINNDPSIDTVNIDDSSEIESIESPESLVVEKIDTSHVEKLTNTISSVRTLMARGMNHEAQTLIVE